MPVLQVWVCSGGCKRETEPFSPTDPKPDGWTLTATGYVWCPRCR